MPKKPKVECVCCETSYENWWEYVEHLKEQHGHSPEAASTLALGMVTWSWV